MRIGWEEVLEAMYGTQVSDKQIPIWEHYLKSENTNSAELVKTIEMAANESMKPEEWRVTVRDLTKWLRVYRKRQRAQNATQVRTSIIDGFVLEWREKIARGAKKDDAIAATIKISMGFREENDILNRIFSK